MKKLLLLGILIVAACKKELQEAPLHFTLQLTSKEKNITMDSVYAMIDGRNYNIRKFKIYLSDFQFVDNMSRIQKFDTVFLLEHTSSFELPLAKGNYRQMTFHIGIDSVTNNTINPLLLPDSHPLSLVQEMFWDMTRYRFVFWEGSFNNSFTGIGSPNAPYSFHLGRDVAYRSVTLNGSYALDDHNTLLLDINKMMYNTSDTLSFTTTFSNHSNDSEMAEAKILMDNLSEAFSLK